MHTDKTPHSASPSLIDRRKFLQTGSLAAGAFAFGVPALLRGQNLNSKLNIACIGIGGKGRSDTDACAGENIVALCDVDSGSEAYEIQTKKYPGAKVYKDFRQMLDQMGSQIDAVTVSTPDHMHAIIASAAMKRHKAVFCQKPLTQTIYEARYLRKMAHDKKIVTQMGNQGSAADGLRRAVETIQDGLIGQVHEVHVWTNRPIWPQAMERPAGSDPVPATLDWDIWIGPAPMRPYIGSHNPDVRDGIYEPFNWRGWQDFGTGALGDMGCHTANLLFRALKLDTVYPTSVEGKAIDLNEETYPSWATVVYEFPARGDMPPVKVTWYDGDARPPQEVQALVGPRKIPGQGSIFIGTKGVVLLPHTAMPMLFPEDQFKGFELPKAESNNHYHQFVDAVLGDAKVSTPFDYAGPLTEAVLLGPLASRFPKTTLEWDSAHLKFRNSPEATAFVRRRYRSGWEVKGL